MMSGWLSILVLLWRYRLVLGRRDMDVGVTMIVAGNQRDRRPA